MLALSSGALAAASHKPRHHDALLARPPQDAALPQLNPYEYAKHLRNNPACHSARDMTTPADPVRDPSVS